MSFWGPAMFCTVLLMIFTGYPVADTQSVPVLRVHFHLDLHQVAWVKKCVRSRRGCSGRSRSMQQSREKQCEEYKQNSVHFYSCVFTLHSAGSAYSVAVAIPVWHVKLP